MFTILSDTKIVSKIFEIHFFPKILTFAQTNKYKVVLAEHQNYYPDISFVKASDESIRFAVDFKTTYRNPKKPHLCNGFTLGSHGEYFENRTSSKKYSVSLRLIFWSFLSRNHLRQDSGSNHWRDQSPRSWRTTLHCICGKEFPIFCDRKMEDRLR